MAKIKIESDRTTVVLGEPDEDGDYRWECLTCGALGDAFRPLDEAVNDAEVHVDVQCLGVA